MPIKTYRPTTPTRRFQTSVSREDITKERPEKSLVESKKRTGGRNSTGRVTSRFIGGDEYILQYNAELGPPWRTQFGVVLQDVFIAADEPRSHPARAVAAAGALLGFHQRFLGTFLGDVLAGNRCLETPGRGRGSISLDRHGRFPLNLREVGDFLPRLQLHVGLLPVRTVPGESAPPPQFAVERRGTHFVHLDLEQLLHRGLDLRLVGFRVYLETQRTLGIFLEHALLCHQWALYHFIEVHLASASENLRAAASEISTLL